MSAVKSLVTKIETATLKALSEEGVTVLTPMEPGPVTVEFVETDTSTVMMIKDGQGGEMNFCKPYRQSDYGGDWHPARWNFWQSRVDLSGKKWTCYRGQQHVIDDFGTLVPVEGGAA